MPGQPTMWLDTPAPHLSPLPACVRRYVARDRVQQYAKSHPKFAGNCCCLPPRTTCLLTVSFRILTKYVSGSPCLPIQAIDQAIGKDGLRVVLLLRLSPLLPLAASNYLCEWGAGCPWGT